jgi:hypothetical protein
VQELISLLPDGASVAAVILVVVLFLKQHEKINAMLTAIAKDFNAHIHESQKGFHEQILGLTKQQYEHQKSYQDQIQALIDAHIKVSRETIMALKTLEASIRELKDGKERSHSRS